MSNAATSFPARLQQAAAMIGQGDIAVAQTLLSALLREAPQHPDVLQLLGVVHRRSGRSADAIACFRASLAVSEAQPHVHNNLGGALAASGQKAAAAKHYRRALALKPGYADAAYNLALLSLDSEPAEAKALLEAAVRGDPKHARAFEALALALRRLGDPVGALAAASRAVALAPGSHTAQHNLGLAAMEVGDYAAAESAYAAALKLQPASDATWVGLGNALRSQERNEDAAKAFERAVAANPSNTDAHRLLNEMLWQTGAAHRYLGSYPVAINARPSDVGLRLSYANELLRIMQHGEALKELAAAAQGAPDDALVNDAIARAWSMAGDFERAVSHHRRATEASPQTAPLAQNLLETLLKAGRHDEALSFSNAAHKKFPLDQGILALSTTALRLTGDERHDRIADFAALPKVMRVDPPEGFADEFAFNAALAEALRRLHATKNHPTDQTLRGGTQTFGALFQRADPLIRQLRVQLEKAIAQYVAEMPDDPEHPLFGRKSSAFAFSGSWSARLAADGFHTNHFHSQGWISSAYYVAVPDEVGQSDTHAGWLKMGETNLQLGARDTVQRLVRPQVGHLVLFPSYFWHGTVPFHTPGERLTVAFDVVPT